MWHLILTGQMRIVLILFVLFGAGCVSKGKFQMKVDENTTLFESLNQAHTKVGELKKAREELEKLNSYIKGELEESVKREEALKKRVEGLMREVLAEKKAGIEAEKSFTVEQKGMNAALQERREEWEVLKGSLLSKVEAKELELSRLEIESAELRKSLEETAFEREKKARELKDASRAHRDFVRKLTNEINDGVIKISKLKNSLSIEIVDSILFESGSAEIIGEGRKILKKVSKVLMNVKENNIRVEGHTDNIPIGKGLKKLYPSNWELSSARATGVVRYLGLQGIAPEILVPVGFSKFRPVATNETFEGRRRNRRIEIVLFPRDIQEIVKSVDRGFAFK